MKRNLLTTIIATMILMGCNATQTTKPQIQEYKPENKKIFVFNEKSPKLQQYGYSTFCISPKDKDYRTCLKNLPYRDYVYKKGYYETNEPIQIDIYDNEFWPVVLETGEKYFLKIRKGRKHDDLLSLEEYKAIKNFKKQPLVPESEIFIVATQKLYDSQSFTLSTGETIYEDKLNHIRELSKKYKNQADIANLLIKMDIKKDDIENRFFISPKQTELTSEAKLYIGLNDSDIWLRFSVQYQSSDWLFVHSYKVAADDYRWQSPKLSFKRDNSARNVWEWNDSAATNKHLEIAQKLAKAQKSTIRFQGSKYYADRTLTDQQKQNLLDIITLHKLMKTPL